MGRRPSFLFVSGACGTIGPWRSPGSERHASACAGVRAASWPMRIGAWRDPRGADSPRTSAPTATRRRRLRTASMVFRIPSRLALSKTCLTRSGRDLAFASRLFSANSIAIRSVPAETSETAVLTSTVPRRAEIAGTSCTDMAPSFGKCTSCFNQVRLGKPGTRVHRTAKLQGTLSTVSSKQIAGGIS